MSTSGPADVDHRRCHPGPGCSYSFTHAKDEVSDVARLWPTRVPAEPSGSPYADQRSRRDRNVDRVVLGASGAYAALVLLLSVAPVLGDGFDPTPGREFWVGLVIGVLSCAALKWRRRFPVQLGLATVLAGAVSPTAGIASLVMLGTVAIHRRWPWAALVGGATSCCPACRCWPPTRQSAPQRWLVLGILAVLLTAVPIGIGMRIRSRRLRMDALRERAERAEAEQSRVADTARQAERTRIAREMHDVLAHRISLVSMHAGALEYLPNASPDEVATAAGGHPRERPPCLDRPP
jgi:signal transduction histidine kinase